MTYYSSPCFNKSQSSLLVAFCLRCVLLYLCPQPIYIFMNTVSSLSAVAVNPYFLDVFGSNSQEASKNSNQFVHLFEFLHLPQLVHQVCLRACFSEVTERIENSFSCTQVLVVGYQREKVWQQVHWLLSYGDVLCQHCVQPSAEANKYKQGMQSELTASFFLLVYCYSFGHKSSLSVQQVQLSQSQQL